MDEAPEAMMLILDLIREVFPVVDATEDQNEADAMLQTSLAGHIETRLAEIAPQAKMDGAVRLCAILMSELNHARMDTAEETFTHVAGLVRGASDDPDSGG